MIFTYITVLRHIISFFHIVYVPNNYSGMLHPAPEPAKLTKFYPNLSFLFPSEVDPSIDKLAELSKRLTKVDATKSEGLTESLEIFMKEDIVFKTVKNLSDNLFNKREVRHSLRSIMKSLLKK